MGIVVGVRLCDSLYSVKYLRMTKIEEKKGDVFFCGRLHEKKCTFAFSLIFYPFKEQKLLTGGMKKIKLLFEKYIFFINFFFLN